MESLPSKIYVTGVLRNCSTSLENTLLAITDAVQPFTIERVFLVESDSEDNTVDELQRLRLGPWAGVLDFDSLGNLRSSIPDRIQRISHCREVCRLELSRILNAGDHVIVADMDGVASHLSEFSISRAIESCGDSFDAISANSIPRYYDILALRAQGWIEEDYRSLYRRLRVLGQGHFSALYEALITKQKSIPSNGLPIEVQSAFGGLTIYSGKAFLSSKYSVGPENECEHVSFNKNLAAQGFKAAICPSMCVRSPLQHVWASSPIIDWFWKIARAMKM